LETDWCVMVEIDVDEFWDSGRLNGI
jgi:hypothetical protein